MKSKQTGSSLNSAVSITVVLMTLSTQLLNTKLLFLTVGSRHGSGVGIQAMTGWAGGRKAEKRPTRQCCEWDLTHQRSKMPHVTLQSTSIKVYLKEQGCEC